MIVRQWLMTALITFLPALAWAHPGHALSNGFIAGLAHPWSGVDHLAAMLAVGVWASQLGGRRQWMVPVSFVTLMLMGAALGTVLGTAGMQPGAVEQAIAASVCILGLLIAGAIRLPALLCIVLTGGFAVFHGHAHAAEAPMQANLAFYMAGFACSTLALHGLGFMLARLLVRHQPASLRWTGAALALGGLAMLAS